MPFLYFTISLCLGILFSSHFKIHLLYLFSLIIFFILGAFFSLNRRTISHICIFLVVFFLGSASYQISDILPNNHISKLTPLKGEEIILNGAVIDYPIVSTTFYNMDKSSFILKMGSYMSGDRWVRAEGLIKVNLYGNRLNESPDFGDEIVLKGTISKPRSFRNPGLFDYVKYLQMKEIYSVLTVKDGFSAKILRRRAAGWFRNSAYAVRRVICNAIDRFFDVRQLDNGYLKAILAGDRSNLKKHLEEDFIKTGTVHILSISGTHVGLIACIFFFIFSVLNIPKKINLILTVSLLIFYAFLVGLNPPIVRSTIMFAVFAAGYIINKEGDMLNTLFLAAFLILLPQPKTLFDPGFQLSFTSLAGIIVLSPRIEGLFRQAGAAKRSILFRMRLYALKAVSVSVAAWLGVAPVVSVYFNIVSPVTVIANLIIVPAVFLMMILSFAFLPAAIARSYLFHSATMGAPAAFLGIIAGRLASIIHFLDRILFMVNRSLAQLPFSFFRTPAPSPLFFVGYYLALLILVFPRMRGLFFAAIRKRYVQLALLLFLNVVVWRGIFCHREGDLRVTFLDVGKGDSALVEFPGGRAMLIDGGSGGSEEKLDMGRIVVAPYLWKRGITKLDAVVATHFHEDHLGGLLYILDNFDIGCVIDNGADTAPQNILYGRYKKIIKRRRIRRIIVGAGDEIKGISSAVLLFMNPRKGGEILDSNENSLVMKLVYEGSSILFAGDIDDNALPRLNSYGEILRANILKFPHHGGVFKDTEALRKFLYNVSPQFSVISGRRVQDRSESFKNIFSISDGLGIINYDTGADGAVIAVEMAKGFEIKAPRTKN